MGPDFEDPAYRRGYLAGLIRGDGLLASYRYERVGRSPPSTSFASHW